MSAATHGQRANKSGKILEGVVRNTLVGDEAFGFQLFTNKQYAKAEAKGALPPRYLVKNSPYTTLYGTKGKTEFKLFCNEVSSTEQFPVTGAFQCRVECKYQKVAGSVDEKFPHLYLNCLLAMEEENVIILLEAPGARKAAVDWLYSAVKQKLFASDKPKRIVVMNMTDFIGWANDAFGAYAP